MGFLTPSSEPNRWTQPSYPKWEFPQPLGPKAKLKVGLNWKEVPKWNETWSRLKGLSDLFVNFIPVSPAGTRRVEDFSTQLYDNIIFTLNRDIRYDDKFNHIWRLFFKLLFNDEVDKKGVILKAIGGKEGVQRKLITSKVVPASS